MSDDPWAAIAQPQKAETYDELIGNPWDDRQYKLELIADATIGLVAALLAQRADHKTAGLLLDVERVVIESDYESRTDDLWLEVSSDDLPRFNEEVMEILSPLCLEISKRKGYGLDWVGVREVLPTVGPSWREQLREQVAGKRQSNQARRIAVSPPQYVEDGLAFTNPGEQKVYRALKYIQEKEFPSDETIGIFPLPGVKIPKHTWEPDVLVSYKGRAGIIEVDGPDHNRRRAMDNTRDHLLIDAGIAFVDRIPVEALNDAKELTAVLRRFLKRLGDAR